MKMANKVMCILIGLIVFITYSSISLANGGPMGGAALVKGGRIEFINIEDIEVAKEKLEIKIGTEFVFVKASYELVNKAGEKDIDYAFPVKLFLGEHFSEPEVYDFKIKDGDEAVDYTIQEGEWSEPAIEQEKNDYYISQISFQENEVKNLSIEYKVYPNYLDWGTSKRTFPSFDQHLFAYDLLPASHWGDGIIKDFELIVDASEIYNVNGYLIETSFKEVDIQKSINRIQIDNLVIEDYPTLSIAYSMDDYKLQKFISRSNMSNHIVGLKASSTLNEEKYSLLNMLDDNDGTCWVEGNEGNGVGEWFEIEFNEPTYIESLLLANGFYINEDLYNKNSRLKKITVEYEMGPDRNKEMGYQTFEYEDRAFSQEFFKKYVEARLSQTCSRIKVTIDEVYSGSAYEDVCITEILPLGWSDKVIGKQEIKVVHNIAQAKEKVTEEELSNKEEPKKEDKLPREVEPHAEKDSLPDVERENAEQAIEEVKDTSANKLTENQSIIQQSSDKETVQRGQSDDGKKSLLYLALGILLGGILALSIVGIRKK